MGATRTGLMLVMMAFLTVAVGPAAADTPTPATPVPTPTVTPTCAPVAFSDFAFIARNGRPDLCLGCFVSIRKNAASMWLEPSVTSHAATGRYETTRLSESGLYDVCVKPRGGTMACVTQHLFVVKCAGTHCFGGRCDTAGNGSPETVIVGTNPSDRYYNLTNGDRWRFAGTAGLKTGWTLDNAGGGGGGGGGTVTSVNGGTSSALLTVGGGPFTDAGTITVDFVDQAANKVVATGPSGGKPDAQSLSVAHLPSMSSSEVRGKVADETGTGPLVFGIEPLIELLRLKSYTVATLPTPSIANPRRLAWVTDATSPTDCTTGGASGGAAFAVLCFDRGDGTWRAVVADVGGTGNVVSLTTSGADNRATRSSGSGGHTTEETGVIIDDQDGISTPDGDPAFPNRFGLFRNTVPRTCSSNGIANKLTLIDVADTANVWTFCFGSTNLAAIVDMGGAVIGDDQIAIGNGVNSGGYGTLPHCVGANECLRYNASTNEPYCGAVAGGGATPTATATPALTPTPTVTATPDGYEPVDFCSAGLLSCWMLGEASGTRAKTGGTCSGTSCDLTNVAGTVSQDTDAADTLFNGGASAFFAGNSARLGCPDATCVATRVVTSVAYGCYLKPDSLQPFAEIMGRYLSLGGGNADGYRMETGTDGDAITCAFAAGGSPGFAASTAGTVAAGKWVAVGCRGDGTAGPNNALYRAFINGRQSGSTTNIGQPITGAAQDYTLGDSPAAGNAGMTGHKQACWISGSPVSDSTFARNAACSPFGSLCKCDGIDHTQYKTCSSSSDCRIGGNTTALCTAGTCRGVDLGTCQGGSNVGKWCSVATQSTDCPGSTCTLSTLPNCDVSAP